MTEPQQPSEAQPEPERPPITPSRHDRLRPLELVGFAGVLALFAGVVVLYVTRGWLTAYGWAFAGIFAGVGFIVVLLTVALVGLGGKPSKEDDEARKDLQPPDKDGWH